MSSPYTNSLALPSIEDIFNIQPILTAAWFSPLAVGGMFLAIAGGFVLHIVSGRILLVVSALGFAASGLLFALMPPAADDQQAGDGGGGRLYTVDVLYWAFVFPAMLCGTIGVDIQFNVSNIFITTSMPARLQATAGGLMNSVYYLGMAFWLGIGDLATSTAASYRPAADGPLEPRERYQIGFWVMVALGAVSVLLVATIDLGRAESDQTADEKAAQADADAARARAGSQTPAENAAQEDKATT